MKFLRYLCVGFALSALLSALFYGGSGAIGSEPSTPSIRQPVWSVERALNQAYDQTLTVKDGLVFVSTFNPFNNPDGQFYALDATSGAQQWASDEPVQKVLRVENGTVYATNPSHRLMALDTRTGATKTALQIGEPLPTGEWLETDELSELSEPSIDIRGSAIAAYNDTFILGMALPDQDRDEIFSLTVDNQQQWRFLTPPDSLTPLDFYEPYDVIKPTLQDGVLVLTTLVNPSTDARGYEIIALDAATGRPLWTWKTSVELDDVTVIGDTVYPTYSHSSASDDLSWVKALDLKTGQERWSHSISGRAELASDREVFVWEADLDSGDEMTHFVVLDKQSGTELRRLTLPCADLRENRRLALANNVLYINEIQIENSTVGFYASADNHSWINAFDATTGQLLWRIPTLQHSHVYRPVIEGDRLFVASQAIGAEATAVVQAFDISCE